MRALLTTLCCLGALGCGARDDDAPAALTALERGEDVAAEIAAERYAAHRSTADAFGFRDRVLAVVAFERSRTAMERAARPGATRDDWRAPIALMQRALGLWIDDVARTGEARSRRNAERAHRRLATMREAAARAAPADPGRTTRLDAPAQPTDDMVRELLERLEAQRARRAAERTRRPSGEEKDW